MCTAALSPTQSSPLARTSPNSPQTASWPPVPTPDQPDNAKQQIGQAQPVRRDPHMRCGRTRTPLVRAPLVHTTSPPSLPSYLLCSASAPHPIRLSSYTCAQPRMPTTANWRTTDCEDTASQATCLVDFVFFAYIRPTCTLVLVSNPVLSSPFSSMPECIQILVFPARVVKPTPV
jgi:hypothetical protein